MIIKAGKDTVASKLRRVNVYRNLTNGLWSIKQGGRVIAHLACVTLKDCRFLVQPAGRQRVLKEGRKNVHAYVSGYLTEEKIESKEHVFYNPYKYETFVDEFNNPIHVSDYCVLREDHSVRIKNNG